ncbi:Zn(2)-C6 fungal-type DNA-binding domain-containing protein [Pochonia chlamydosporia 170]|uniref:Zn(2)-C6 fungal-type DNA-binding domain-containing protein n=1 Tax=Pochonia chlamydosporia 170 TaxID=1380566 RepID=A0A179EY45_METCM|nr:Zn(2)-C6 fungal-type DNA-binding domain-containing protein [Pochonia chlamydosporia 170]OAQ58117.1 Zn(2)-C6 fungal-type DNA-binding domain-containing protein [Pochonia chlamydosporia 170]
MLRSKFHQTLISHFAPLCYYTLGQMSSQGSQIVRAPSEEAITGIKSVFLAGTTTTVDNVDWREKLSASLSEHPITIFNPNRPDWDSTWREDISFAPYREQVLWELDKQVQADLVVVYFHPATVAPISLLEFGLSAQVPGKVIAIAPKGYSKRGNVQIVCQKFGIEFLDNIDELHGVIVNKLHLHR